ncbi:unnamed protein product [Arabis nemorensis]|uniref:Uncharacterized protein n=1 Tax=Arabis nemorensis TaxID=586526 RepID=A0A565C418_9BRAS|nr:unnamed protein product [Arabis nemorensis]
MYADVVRHEGSNNTNQNLTGERRRKTGSDQEHIKMMSQDQKNLEGTVTRAMGVKQRIWPQPQNPSLFAGICCRNWARSVIEGKRDELPKQQPKSGFVRRLAKEMPVKQFPIQGRRRQRRWRRREETPP